MHVWCCWYLVFIYMFFTNSLTRKKKISKLPAMIITRFLVLFLHGVGYSTPTINPTPECEKSPQNSSITNHPLPPDLVDHLLFMPTPRETFPFGGVSKADQETGIHLDFFPLFLLTPCLLGRIIILRLWQSDIAHRRPQRCDGALFPGFGEYPPGCVVVLDHMG